MNNITGKKRTEISRDQQDFNNLMAGATPAQHRYLFVLGMKKGLTKKDIWKLQEKFAKKFKLWVFSDINQSQMQEVYKFIENL